MKTDKNEPIREKARQVLKKIGRLFRRRPEFPDDPYAYVTAPKKPRFPSRSAAAVAERPES
jgi:hypothetical protein